jgi:hypothetical protein
MVKCPFCGFSNEDGALFCEQCKSDLSAVAPPPPPPPPVADVIEAMPMAEVMPPPPPPAEVIPSAAVVEEPPMAIAEPLPEPLPAMAPPPPDVAPAAEAAPPPVPAAAPSPPAKGGIPAGAQPKLVVMRGQKIGMEFPVYPGENYIGRSDEKPVDIDLEDQEPPDRVWCSRQHALLHFDEGAGTITLEDLNSSNGTYVNRDRVYPGQPRPLSVNDRIQIGTVHLTLKV